MTASTGLRRLWRRPGRFEDRDPGRRVSFLELFFELVACGPVSRSPTEV